jgi:hypothetical protein
MGNKRNINGREVGEQEVQLGEIETRNEKEQKRNGEEKSLCCC